MSRTRVLFIARRFPPSVGGMERFAFDLYQNLAKRADVKLIKWGGGNKYLPIVLPFFFIRACWILATQKIDIIHIQDGLQSPMGVLLKLIWRKPVCVVIHGLDVTYDNALYQAVVPRCLKRVDAVICISEAAKMEAEKRGINPKQMHVVPLGVTDDIFTGDYVTAHSAVLEALNVDNKNSKVILSVGRLVKRKGVEWFIRQVLPKLIKTHKDVVFVVSGDGEERESIDVAVRELKIGNHVKLLGRVSDAMIKDLYNGSDLFVMPNITVPGDMEGFGRVLIEASLCELPVVATGIEGIRDAITDGKNGELLEELDAAAYVKSIDKVLNDQKLAKRLGRRGRLYSLDKFNWSGIAKQYTDIYRVINR